MGMSYCRNNGTLLPIWKSGLSPCFYYTVTPMLLLLFPIIALVMHHCSARRVTHKKLEETRLNGDTIQSELSDSVPDVIVACRTKSFEDFSFSNLPIPFLYVFQLFMHVMLILYPLVVMLIHMIKCLSCIAIVDILFTVLDLICWLCAFNALKMERKIYFYRKVTHHSAVMNVFWALALLVQILEFVSWNNKQWDLLDKGNNYFNLIMLCLRCFFTASLFVVGLLAPGVYKQSYEYREPDVEKAASQIKSPLRDFWEKSKKLWPFVWPRDNWLRFRVLVCLLLLGANRIVNVYVPLQNKEIVNYLSDKSNKKNPVDLILVYMFLAFLQGGGGVGSMGLLNNGRSFLWVRVQQYTSRSVQTQLFKHLHELSLRWHLQRKTGEVLRMVDRGSQSIESLLSYILFQIAPTIIDIIIALVFFGAAFNGYFALLVFVTMLIYITATIAVTEWRTKYRREMNTMDNSTKSVAVDSLLNFETVKYYNNESYEVKRYADKIGQYQGAQWKTVMSLNVLNTTQNVIITCGLLGGMLYCGSLVTQDLLTLGDFVLFMSYVRQLYQPLNFFGTYYRLIQSAFIDMENMFELLDEKIEVKNAVDAYVLNVESGLVEFCNVDFAYDERTPILKDISFTVHPGQSVALVGPSGSGKSTIIRLLFRFYDIQSGSISIDGQDISQVTQDSLRKVIGVVPQDTVLFNDTIKYNIGYGRINSSDDDVKKASKSADIHRQIESFADGYDTVVGERGLKLSGGEKQRVAIARTMLKSPDVILLDEATSALDTETERNIQTSLNKICVNKTSIVVAHRLSTIVNADQILVLKDGAIVERGTHNGLLDMDGVYANMWNQQLKENE